MIQAIEMMGEKNQVVKADVFPFINTKILDCLQIHPAS